MKKIVSYFILFLMLSVSAIAQVKPSTISREAASVGAQANATVLLARLTTIGQMKGSEMSSSEKRAIRNEVKSIRTNLKTLDGGVYLSGGAIIIILILLIVLL